MTTDTVKSPVPRKLNKGVITALSDSIGKGNYYVTALKLVGISEPAFYEWLKLAEQDELAGLSQEESLYISLAKSLKKAEAVAESKLVEVVRESAEVKREWLPAMTFLERRHPERWGRKDRTSITIDEHKQVTITRVTVVLPPGTDTRQVIEGEAVEIPQLAEGSQDVHNSGQEQEKVD